MLITRTDDRPKMLGDRSACEARRAQLTEAHVAPLSAFAARLRTNAGAGVPEFDPWDGGIHARVLFLLEAPGGRAVGSGFVSRNNPDETAKNFFELNCEAGIDRVTTVTWNVVPWYLGDGRRIRAARGKDVGAGAESLAELLTLLPALSAVVLVGRKAERAAPLIERLRPSLRLFRSPHPSPMFVNRASGNRNRILAVLTEVAAFMKASAPAA